MATAEATEVVMCKFVETIPDKLFVCSVCDAKASTNKMPSRKCGPTEPRKVKPPGLLQKAANFGKAAVATAKDGFKKAPPELVAARLAVCETCDRRNPKNNSCLECGCALKYKPLMAAWDCPLKRWPADLLPILQADPTATSVAAPKLAAE